MLYRTITLFRIICVVYLRCLFVTYRKGPPCVPLIVLRKCELTYYIRSVLYIMNLVYELTICVEWFFEYTFLIVYKGKVIICKCFKTGFNCFVRR